MIYTASLLKPEVNRFFVARAKIAMRFKDEGPEADVKRLEVT
jgi:hypothetical protein